MVRCFKPKEINRLSEIDEWVANLNEPKIKRVNLGKLVDETNLIHAREKIEMTCGHHTVTWNSHVSQETIQKLQELRDFCRKQF